MTEKSEWPKCSRESAASDLDLKELKIVGTVSHSGKIVNPKGICSTVLGQRMNTVPHIELSGLTNGINTLVKSTAKALLNVLPKACLLIREVAM